MDFFHSGTPLPCSSLLAVPAGVTFSLTLLYLHSAGVLEWITDSHSKVQAGGKVLVLQTEKDRYALWTFTEGYIGIL